MKTRYFWLEENGVTEKKLNGHFVAPCVLQHATVLEVQSGKV